VRARALGLYLLVFQGGLGIGSALWGLIAQHVGASTALGLSALGVVLGLAAIRRWPLRAITTRELAPSAHWPEPHVDVVPDADDGPVLVEVEYSIDPRQAEPFVQAIRELEPIRLRDGASHWAVYHDLSRPGRYVETFVIDSWLEHLRQHDRVTVSDRAVEERVRRFHLGDTPPAISHLIAANSRRP
jgi:transmembrane secretion effector